MTDQKNLPERPYPERNYEGQLGIPPENTDTQIVNVSVNPHLSKYTAFTIRLYCVATRDDADDHIATLNELLVGRDDDEKKKIIRLQHGFYHERLGDMLCRFSYRALAVAAGVIAIASLF